MSIFRLLQRPKPTAPIAKDRLQILLAHERAGTARPDYLPRLHKELLEVIAKYVEIDDDKISVQFENSGNVSTLEVNIELPSNTRLVEHTA